MATKEEKLTVGKKVNNFLDKNKAKLIGVLILFVCFIIGFIIGTVISANAKEKNLAEIEQISYDLTKDSATLEDAEITARIDEAYTKLADYTKKSGIVGVRANLLYADLLFRQGKFQDAIDRKSVV